MSKRRKNRLAGVKVDKSVKNNVSNPTKPKSKKSLKFDFSFEGLYYSVEIRNKFTNYLSSEKEFVKKFRIIRKINSGLDGKNFDDLRTKKEQHCHCFDEYHVKIIKECISEAMKKYNKSDSVDEKLGQLLDNEKLYQLGHQEVRLIGTYNDASGVFRVYLIDYNHNLYPNDSYNKHSKKELKYCPMCGK